MLFHFFCSTKNLTLRPISFNVFHNPHVTWKCLKFMDWVIIVETNSMQLLRKKVLIFSPTFLVSKKPFVKFSFFWEGHKNLEQSSSRFWHYLVTSKLGGRLHQIFVAFLEKLNFKQNHEIETLSYIAKISKSCENQSNRKANRIYRL